MSPYEVMLSEKAREVRQRADYLERYPRDAARCLPDLEKAIAEYVTLVKNA